MNDVLKKSIVFYLFWICSHYISTHLYAYTCAPWSIQGFFMSPFLTASPQCKALQWFIATGSSSINAMWILIGTFVTNYLIKT